MAMKESSVLKIVTRNQLIVSNWEIEAYKKIISVVRENDLTDHTFISKDQLFYKVVIKNLYHITPHTAIVEEIEKTGNKMALMLDCTGKGVHVDVFCKYRTGRL